MKLSRLLSAPLLLGPTPLLGAFVLLATGVESINLLKAGVEPNVPALYYGAGFFALLAWWIAVVWLFWLISRAILHRAKTRRTRGALWGAIGIAAWLVLFLYALSWATRIYTGVFLNLDSLRMAQADAGAAFIVSFMLETAPKAVTWFAVGAAVSLVTVPVLTRWTLKREWSPEEYQRATRIGKYAFLLSVGIAVCCFGYISSESDIWNRRSQLQFFGRSFSPPASMGSSITQTLISKESVPAELSADARLAIGPVPAPGDEWNAAQKPNVLYIAVESLRADALHEQVDGVRVMPTMHALSQESYNFENGYAQASHTDYAVPSYLSSLYPLRTPDHYYYELDAPWPKKLITDYLAENGYSAGIITSDNTSWGKMRNFMWSEKLDVFFDSSNMPTTYSLTDKNRGYVTSRKRVAVNGAYTAVDKHTVDIAMVWMEKQIATGKPFILHTMLQQTHYPYQLLSDYPEPFQPGDNTTFKHTLFKCPPEKVHIQHNAYRNCAHAVDIEIGRIIQFLKDHDQWDNTILVLVGDHGEAFYEVGAMGHASKSYQSVIRVPMVMRVPGDDGEQVQYPAQQVDMAPTLCAALGLPPHPTYQGINLLSQDRPPLDERYLYISSAVPGFWRGDNIIYAGRWKFWADYSNDEEILIDLQNDPLEQYNVMDKQPALARDLRARLKKWRKNQLAYYKYPMFYTKYYPPRAN